MSGFQSIQSIRFSLNCLSGRQSGSQLSDCLPTSSADFAARQSTTIHFEVFDAPVSNRGPLLSNTNQRYSTSYSANSIQWTVFTIWRRPCFGRSTLLPANEVLAESVSSGGVYTPCIFKECVDFGWYTDWPLSRERELQKLQKVTKSYKGSGWGSVKERTAWKLELSSWIKSYTTVAKQLTKESRSLLAEGCSTQPIYQVRSICWLAITNFRAKAFQSAQQTTHLETLIAFDRSIRSIH